MHESFNKIEQIRVTEMCKIGEIVSKMDIDAASVLAFVELLESLTNI